jgi:hypothetical protein
MLLASMPINWWGQELFSPLLQDSLEVTISQFTVCNAVRYAPISWTAVSIIFIPKPGHNCYIQVNPFHPTGLTFLLSKTMKMLVDRYIPDGDLVRHPAHLQEHAHETGRALQTALHILLYKFERVPEDGLVALGVSLDIEGAFIDTIFECMHIT